MQSGRKVFLCFLCRIKRHGHPSPIEPLWVHEILLLPRAENRWRKRHPKVSMFNHFVKPFDDRLISWVCKDRTIPQRSLSKLHPSRKSSADVSMNHLFDNPVQRWIVNDLVSSSGRKTIDRSIHIILRKSRTEVHTCQRTDLIQASIGFLEMFYAHVVRSAKRHRT